MREIHWTWRYDKSLIATKYLLKQHYEMSGVPFFFAEPCWVHILRALFYSLYDFMFTCCAKPKANKLKGTDLILSTICSEYEIVFFFISIRIVQFVNSMSILIDLSLWCVHACTVSNDSLTETWSIVWIFIWIFKRLTTVHIE